MSALAVVGLAVALAIFFLGSYLFIRFLKKEVADLRADRREGEKLPQFPECGNCEWRKRGESSAEPHQD